MRIYYSNQSFTPFVLLEPTFLLQSSESRAYENSRNLGIFCQKCPFHEIRPPCPKTVAAPLKLIKNSILFKCKNNQLKTIICKTDKNVSFCQEIAKILLLLSIPYFFGEMHPSCLCS